MRKALIIYFISIGFVTAQNNSKYTVLEGKGRDLVYAQITEKQEFCTYEALEHPEKTDPMWDSFFKVEISKFNPTDSVQIIPIHKFSYQIGLKYTMFLKYKIIKKGANVEYKILNFQKISDGKWQQAEVLEMLDKAMSYLFHRIKTDTFQKIFSREDYENEELINQLKHSVLQKDGYVNFDMLYRKLKEMEGKSDFLMICN